MIDARHRVTIGKGTYGMPDVFWWGEDAKVEIGKYCSISEKVNIFLGGEHNTDWITTYPFNVIKSKDFGYIEGHPKTKGNVTIENDVWIGYGATIMSGSVISSGAVIGANSLISGYVGPYQIWAGNPGRYVMGRFPYNVVDQLLSIAWWDWPEEKIEKYIPLLLSKDVAGFIDAAMKED